MNHMPDGLAGAVLDDGCDGERDREVCFDRVAAAGEEGPGAEVGFGHSEGLFHVPQVVVAPVWLGSGHEAGGPW